MTAAIHDFKSIKRKLDRQEQKVEFEAKNPVPETGTYGWPVFVPFSGVATGGLSGGVTITTAELPAYTPKQVNG